MWRELLRFELRQQSRQPMLWLLALALLAIAVLTASSDTLRIGGAIGNVHLNAPTVVANQLGVLTIVSMFLVTVFIAGAVLRDDEVGMTELLFATPIGGIDYLVGRFLAGWLLCVLLFAASTLAMFLGARLPSIDPGRLGPPSAFPYLWSFLVLAVPNLLFVTALLLWLAVTTRSLVGVYAGVLLLMALWAAAGALHRLPEGELLANALDPFGLRALHHATRYFTSEELNTRLPKLVGALLWNRLGWGVAAAALASLTILRFQPHRIGTGSGRGGLLRRAAATRGGAPVPAPPSPAGPAAPAMTLHFDGVAAWHQFGSLLRLHVKGILGHSAFLVMLMLALANFITNYLVGGLRIDSRPYPLTRLMLAELDDGMNMVLGLVVLFFAGELVFKDRQARISGMIEAMPVAGWVPLGAQAGALICICQSFLFAGVLAALAIQVVVGGAPVELGLYVKGTLLASTRYVLLALGMLALQVLVDHRYAGFALSLGLLLGNDLLSGLGCTDRLYRFADLPLPAYSDLNGYGDWLHAWAWHAAYWAGAVLALLALARLLGATGGRTWRERWRAGGAALRCGGNAAVATVLAGAALWAACGAWIFYNTHVRNAYADPGDRLDARADYERTYRPLAAAPQPRLVAVRADVALFPAERRASIRGHYVLANTSDRPLDILLLQRDPGHHEQVATSLSGLPPHRVRVDDPRLGAMIVKLDAPLPPGGTLGLDFAVEVRHPGFTNDPVSDGLDGNGSLITSERFFPTLGYNPSLEIEDPGARRERGLGPPHGLADRDDVAARSRSYWARFGFAADLIDFDATVSTSADQIAVAPGDLVESGEAGGRRFFHYRMRRPILPFFAFVSGRYAVHHESWRGIDIAIYHHPGHTYNIDSMSRGARRALEDYTEHFGPYPYGSVRIAEVPLYRSEARSLPELILFSESLGFINDLRGADTVDHVFYITAHELAHEWWGDQVIAADVQGNGILTESLAEYSALRVLAKEYGPEKLGHVLRYDLDQYLRGRGEEMTAETPLEVSEGRVYLDYRKGSLAMHRLAGELGEAMVNRALRQLADTYRFASRPYPTTRELLACLRSVTPPDKQALLGELFQRIVVYENRVLQADARPRRDGRWDVTLRLHLGKLEADGRGRETQLPYDEPVDIALYGASPGPALLRVRRVLPAGDSALTLTVDARPAEVALDPEQLRIVRNPGELRKGITSVTGD